MANYRFEGKKMLLFDGPSFQVSQGFFSGWKIINKLTGGISVPDSLLKERVGLVWMQVRKTKSSMSIDSRMSEDVMFGSFAHAVSNPSSEEGAMWRSHSPDNLADFFIDLGNRYIRGEA